MEDPLKLLISIAHIAEFLNFLTQQHYQIQYRYQRSVRVQKKILGMA
ncbi:hypothetical protein CLOHYLEM_07686 [[Clostridium] hylemonae DSM 15053]|uniref:Uncharacterized protein n=1 Tax=[Clostridium] hylemonae DSM 15053 TaxID=553973 RepID=C0C6E9_9FIRM|nr:hypothetical protein CLOHYLEM_07686 [[Clostridium] hylemonae DSM 15053]